MFHYETQARDALVKIDDTPLWVRVQAIDVVQPDEYPTDYRTRIVLRNGQVVFTDKSVGEVIGVLSKAMQNAPL